MISVDNALATVLAHTPTLSEEEVGIEGALGRVLAEDIFSDVDMPPFDRSAMDGYALRAEDVTKAPVTLDVIGQVRAGVVGSFSVSTGQAVQIMTGAPVPLGATAVQRLERTRSLGSRVEVLVPVEVGESISRKGSEVRAGEKVLSRGITVDPSVVGVLAAVGKGRLKAGRRPRVSILVTGDELVDVWDRPTGGQIRNSNGYSTAAQASWAGAIVTSIRVVGDRIEDIVLAMREGFAADVLVLSGGVSEGAFDLVEDAMSRLDVGVLFEKVAIKPGAPLVFGTRGEKLVFGLPGNPVSAQVTFDVFVRAALLRMQGARVTSRPAVEVELLEDVRNASGRRAHLPGRVRFEGGRLVGSPLRSMGSADLVTHARANALLVLETHRVRAAAGERVPALLLGNFLERDGLS